MYGSSNVSPRSSHVSTHTRSLILPCIFVSLSVHLCLPPAAHQLDPSGRGLVCGGLFINKRPLFHTQLDVCRRAREGPTMSSTMLQKAAKATKNKTKQTFCSVSCFYIQKQLQPKRNKSTHRLVLGRNTSNMTMTKPGSCQKSRTEVIYYYYRLFYLKTLHH